jgi:uncharacterized SAM-binding protein YcdF (DUF218 family)
MKGYPRRFLLALLLVCALAWVSGLLLAPTTLALRAEWALPWRLSAPARLAVAALHTTAAFALVFLCGALWARHMRDGWHNRCQRASGVATGASLLALTVTALFIFYAGDDAWANAAAFVHLTLGALLALPLLWHGLRPRWRDWRRQE